MSVIDDIYRSIGNMELGGVPSRNIDKLSLEVAQADLPLRLMLPPTSDGSFLAIGTLQRITWSIRDLCLWAPLDTAEDRNMQPMMEYAKAYLEALRAIRSPADQSWISDFAVGIGQRPWSDAVYWAIDVMLTVEEAL